MGEQQAPRLHCVFAAACAAAGLPTGPDGPQLYVGSSTETAIYCIRLPAAGWAEGGSVAAPVAALLAALPRKGQLAAVRATEAATLQRSRSAPLIAELQDAAEPGCRVPGSFEQRADATGDARPRSSGGLAAAAACTAVAMQLDRSRWRSGAGASAQPLQRQQPAGSATALAVMITGALVDLLQVTLGSYSTFRTRHLVFQPPWDVYGVVVRTVSSGLQYPNSLTSMACHRCMSYRQR